MDLRAVVFDFFGTLTVGRNVEAQTSARRAQAEALGVDADAFDRMLTETYRERFLGVTGGVEKSLQWVAIRLGADPDAARLAAAARVRIATERAFATTRDEALPLLRRLRAAGLRIGLVSDCSAELPITFPDLPMAGLVDTAVLSWESGLTKPDPENYLQCCAGLEVAPEHCVYVGDGGSDELEGARRVGMTPVHLDVAAERGGVVYGRHATWDGATIGGLDELPDLLTRLTGREI